MNRLVISVISFALLSSGGVHQILAEETPEKPPHVSFGAAGSYNGYGVWERKKGDQYFDYKIAQGYGGGVILEKMYNNLLGINSGIWFNRLNLDIRIKQRLGPASINSNLSPLNFIAMKITVSGWSVSIPLSLVISLNTKIFSLNFLSGIKYTHIVESRIRPDNLMMQYKKFFDMLPYLNQPQFGFSLGVTFRFRVATFVDIFLGCSGDLYVTSLFKRGDNIPLLYAINTYSGVMFRTNIFPMKD